MSTQRCSAYEARAIQNPLSMQRLWLFLLIVAAGCFTSACSEKAGGAEEEVAPDSPGVEESTKMEPKGGEADNGIGPDQLKQVKGEDVFGNKESYFVIAGTEERHGLFFRHSPEGTLVEEATFVRDTLNGQRTLYYAAGDTHIVETYDMGVFDGPYRSYYKNGRLQQKGLYVDNAMRGKWYQWYDDGTLKEVVTFEDNKENGPFTAYHPNGNIKARGNYKDGDNEHGLLELYDEAGNLIKKMDCKVGICRTIWSRNDENI